jgi:NTE family protein
MRHVAWLAVGAALALATIDCAAQASGAPRRRLDPDGGERRRRRLGQQLGASVNRVCDSAAIAGLTAVMARRETAFAPAAWSTSVASALRRARSAWSHPARCLMLAATLALAGCSTFQPAVNQTAVNQATRPAPAVGDHGLIVAVTLSGGGARAAAFGLGVLRELKDTALTVNGRPTTLLDEVALISGVSGGSVLAAHYAAFGDESLAGFETEFLRSNFEGGLIHLALSPMKLWRLSSPWYGRSHVLAERLEKLFRGRTFGDLAARPRSPDLLITATDLTTGAPFEFTPEQFALICSDLAQLPLSFAVAASSSVPLLLTPMTLRNYAGHCETAPVALPAAAADNNYRTRLRDDDKASYADAAERPFIHLVDGGLVDNLGVRGVLDRIVSAGSFAAQFQAAAPNSIRRVVLVAVNSERDLGERIDQSDRVPTLRPVVETLLFGAGSRLTQATLAMMQDDVQRWRREIEVKRGRLGSPFAPDADLHVISVSLRDVSDPRLRRSLLTVPTAFTIDDEQVEQLIEAGRLALRRSPEFVRLRDSLGESHLRSANLLLPLFGAVASQQDLPEHDASE